MSTTWTDGQGNPYTTLDEVVRYLSAPYEPTNGRAIKRMIDRHRIREIQKKYGIKLPKAIQCWISVLPENESRTFEIANIIPYQSILNPVDFCEIDFTKLKKLPLLEFWSDIYGCYDPEKKEIVGFPELKRVSGDETINGLTKTEINLLLRTIFHINLDIKW